MVKLASVRSTRAYGPRGDTQEMFEFINALAYVIATVLLFAGLILMLPGFDHFAAFIVLMIAISLIVLVNLHDLYAQLAGIDFKLSLLAYDTQLLLVEVATPLVQAVGGILFLVALVLMLKVKGAEELGSREVSALRLFIAGSIFWLLGSIHNSFQVYEKTSLAIQVYQKAVSIPFVIACTLFLVSSVLWMKSWPKDAYRRGQYAAATLAIIASMLLVIASIANISRIIHLRRILARQGAVNLDTLRGGAQERLDFEREHGRPFLQEQEHGRQAASSTETEETFSYREAVIR